MKCQYNHFLLLDTTNNYCAKTKNCPIIDEYIVIDFATQ